MRSVSPIIYDAYLFCADVCVAWAIASWRVRGVTQAGMAGDADSYGRILPNRSHPHASWLVAKVATILKRNPVVLDAVAAAAAAK